MSREQIYSQVAYPIVHSYGPSPAVIAAIGEAPGKDEAQQRRPLVGPAGREHAALLRHNGFDPANVWKSNVTREYREGDSSPTQDDIIYWTPTLEAELQSVQPRIILTLGRIATEWFLGEIPLKYPMRSINGIPHECGCFDSSLSYRSEDAIIMPIIHPSAGLRDGKNRVLVAWAYSQVAKVWKELQQGRPVDIRRGPFDWRAHSGEYLWVGKGPKGTPPSLCITPELVMSKLIGAPYIGLDTEGTAAKPTALQVSPEEGLSFVALPGTPECSWLVKAMNEKLCHRNKGSPLFIIRNALHDIEVAEEGVGEGSSESLDYDADGEVSALGASSTLGLQLQSSRVVDTMYMAYLLRTEPLGLKPGTWRLLNIAMKAYMEVIGTSGLKAQLDYLGQVATQTWGAPERNTYRSNSGRPISWKPTPMHKRAQGILSRIEKGKEVDIASAWSKRESERFKRGMMIDLRAEVEARLGPMPEPSLNDVDPVDFLWYAGSDPDLDARTYHAMMPRLEEMDLVRTLELGKEALPAAAEIQISGMPVNRKYFVDFRKELDVTCDKIQDELALEVPCKIDSEIKQYKKLQGAERYFYQVKRMYKRGIMMQPDDIAKGRVNRYITPLSETDTHPVRFQHHWTESSTYFNPNSSTDTLRLVVDVLGLKPLKTSKKTGLPSTAKDSIAHLAYGKRPENKVIARLFEWRSANKIRQFADDVLESTDEKDLAPRMYERVAMTRTESRRFTQGRLMTIPSRSELGMRVRKGYQVTPGRTLIAADYSRVEPTLAADLSQDPSMLAVCNDPKGDIYKETASGVKAWNVTVAEVTKEQRNISKELFLGGVLYRMGWTGLQASLRQRKGADGQAIELSRQECEAFLGDSNRHFKDFVAWGDREIAKAARQGYVRDPWSGMYRLLPALYLADRSDWRGRKDWAEAEKHVCNHLIQTLAQYMLQNSMSWLHQRLQEDRASGRLSLRQVLLVLQMHDELVLECDDDPDTVVYARDLLRTAMLDHHRLDTCTVPIGCDLEQGQSWGDLKG